MPGSILITPAVLGLAEGTCRSERWDQCLVKGLDAHGGLRAGGCERHPAALAGGGSAGLAARIRHGTRGPGPGLELAGAGQGQVVAVAGEAGVGKSRLVYECVHSPRTQGWLVLESASVSYGKATPYFPVIDLLKQAGPCRRRR